MKKGSQKKPHTALQAIRRAERAIGAKGRDAVEPQRYERKGRDGNLSGIVQRNKQQAGRTKENRDGFPGGFIKF